ncbi:hypothetical protein D9758_012704 [Tetrapyrgos nigripes]|uniref:Uncharacterized protein n=1 Tax=Tetrapyrgos nigripes TaxID=182062 RepID=A0A8H5FUD2_9AGAR|nr:hypothetical protein D9758_012704 [Tetrapyrgos nigripes]
MPDTLLPTPKLLYGPWVALYDIDNTKTFSHEFYTVLHANCSPRKAALIKRIKILDRRTCETYTNRVGQVFSGLLVKLGKMEGWVRTRTYRVIDSLKTGLGIPEGHEAQKVPVYFANYSLRKAQSPTLRRLDTSTFSHKSYARLRANHPPREAALVKKL